MGAAASVRRRSTGLATLVSFALLALLGYAGAATGAPSKPAAAPTASACSSGPGGTVCTNTGPFGTAWNPAANKFASAPRAVTVSQTAGLSGQVVTVSWVHFSPSSSVSPAVNTTTTYPVELLECQTDAPTNIGQCFGSLEYQNGLGAVGGSNKLQATTSSVGTQAVSFGVLSKYDEPSLGCDKDTACSIVVLPWAGGRPPASAASPGSCHDHSADFGGGFVGGNAIVGSWEGSVCAWDSRITVPLSFGPTPDNCGSGDPQFTAQGSPLDSRAMDLWRTGLCTSAAKLNVGYTDLGEYLARNDFGLGAADVAFTTQPADSPGDAVAYAPLTDTAMVVSYLIDDPKTGAPITGLKLNARLLAKMLTQSYAVIPNVNCAHTLYPCAPEVAGNPTNLFTDPEFKSLNPGLTDLRSFGLPGATFPSVVFGDNDSTFEVTRWIESDPDAAAFLAGKADPTGMHVNSAYLQPKGQTLYPTSAFTAQDPGATKQIDAGNCSAAPGGTCVVQGMQVTWNPINGLHNVATQALLGLDSGRAFIPNCNGAASIKVCDQHPGDEQQPLGGRALLAITAASDAAAYKFPTALLETRAGTFVGPTPTAVSAAIGDMATKSNGVSSLDYATLKDPAAYPLTMPTYALIPTCGLPNNKVQAVGTFLKYVASDAGEHSGLTAGDLAPGYVPLTAAQRAATTAAVGKLSAAKCSSATDSPSSSTSPSPKAKSSPSSKSSTAAHSTQSARSGSPSPSPSPRASGGSGLTAGGGGGTDSGGNAGGGANSGGTADSGSGGSGSDGSTTQVAGVSDTQPAEPQEGASGGGTPGTTNAAVAAIHPANTGFGRIALPLLLIFGLLLLAGGGPLAYLSATGKPLPPALQKAMMRVRRGH